MHTYITTTIGFRNKGSLSFNDFYGLNGRTECPYSWGSPLSIHGLAVHPRILYGLRQSTLIQWSASRRLILGGAYGNGYCQLAAAAAARDCERDYRVCCPLKERRRGRKIACMVWESDGCDSSNDGSVEEMLSLMTDVVEKRSRERNGRLAAKSMKKTDDQRCCVCQKEKKVEVDDHSRREEKHVDSGSWKRKSKGEINIRAGEECRRSGREETSRDDNRVVRKDGSSSSYFSVSSNGFESSMDEGIRVKQGNVAGESSSWYKNYSRSEKMGSCNEEVKRIQEHRDGRHNLESSKERITARVSTKQDDRLRSDVGESDVEWGSSKGSMKFAEISDSQESDIRRASLRENRSKMRMEKSEENKDDRHHAGSLSMRIAAREPLRRDHRLGLDVMESNTKLGSMKELEKFTETSQWRESDIQRASSSENCSKIRMEDGEDISTSSANFVCEIRKQFSEEDQRVGIQKESRRESQQLNKISKSREDDIDNISNSQEQINTRTQYREEDTSSHINLIEEERLQHRRKGQRVTGQTESRKKSQSRAGVSEIHDIDIERSSRSQTVFKARVSDREENSTLVLNSVQEAREQSSQRDQQAVRQIQSQKESQMVHESGSHFSDAERLSSSQMVSETRINNQEESLTSAVNLVQVDRRKQYPTDEQVIRQRGSRKQSYAKTSEAHGSNIERASSSSQMLLKTRTKDQVESSTPGLYSVQGAKRHQMGVRIEDNRNSQVMVIPPQSQSVYRGSGQGAFNENTIDTSHSPSTHHEGKTPASLHELDELDNRTGKKGTHDDALGSADRMERSSAEFVGEFVDNLQREALTSHESSLIPKHASEIQKDSKRFSTGSGVKGPSDEMWDVAGPSSQEPFGAEAPEKGSPTAVSESALPTSAGHTVVKRSGRSLWSYIADVVRKSWGARSESHSMPVKSSVQSSSEESLYSDAYFSGREPDNDVDENVRKGRKGLPKELAKDSVGQPSERTSPTQIHEPSDTTSSQDERTVIQADTRISTGTLQRHPAIRGASSVSGEGDGEIEIEKVNEHIPSSAVTTDSSLPLVARPSASTGSSKAFTDKGKILEIGIVEGPMREGITEASVTEGMDREIKQRKLQRNKQVLRERFDEWEEAFKLEHEQRKTDEMFMREALREAKKAADTWEVPVGAVLVQNGKIISRGCNLVEELRDSTAHAEMICIREASNLLRTWRLSETTLYVTLEPCPMCAGAILQARIDTVVWGAPNKLLGADGSWISLFPGGGEEGRDGPIHPFHPKITIRRGILATDCADVMQQFFQLRRKKNKKPESPPSCLPVSNLPSKFFSKVHDAFGMMFCL